MMILRVRQTGKGFLRISISRKRSRKFDYFGVFDMGFAMGFGRLDLARLLRMKIFLTFSLLGALCVIIKRHSQSVSLFAFCLIHLT